MATYEDGYDPKYGYNRHAFEHKTIPQAIVGKVVRLITTPIGLVSEAIQNSKDKKRAQQHEKDGQETTTCSPEQKGVGGGEQSPTYVELPPEQADQLVASGQAVPAEGENPTHELVPEEGEVAQRENNVDLDEEDWVLDEVVASDDENDSPSSSETPSAPPPSYRSSEKLTSRKLPFPVIIPQRRPGTKTRGFVRAYAPVLADTGLDQATFLQFLKDLHTHAQASPIFDVVMVATGLVGAYPNLIVGLATQIVQIGVQIGQEAQERWRTNKFLDQANRDVFAPRGLFAMIVTFKKGTSDTPPVSSITVDMSATAVAKYGKDLVKGQGGAEQQSEAVVSKSRTEEWKEKMKRLRLSSGETTEDEMPVMCAPLIFPQLENAAAMLEKNGGKTTEGQSAMLANIKTKAKGANAFVADYFDRRAQATYAFSNPDTSLFHMTPAPEFKSKMADPNDHRNKHLFTLITGGRWKAEPLGARRRWEAAQRKAAEKRAQGLKDTPKKRLMQEDVLYLMVVNMPTEAELKKAREKMEEDKKSKHKSA